MLAGLASHPINDVANDAAHTKATKTRLTTTGRGGREREAKKGRKISEANTVANLRRMAAKREITRQKMK